MIVYQGPSVLDGEPIVVILNRGRNRKTGDMVQSWIMRADLSPLDALVGGDDRSVCGSCRHRPQHCASSGKRVRGGKGAWGRRTCYVMATGPQTMWLAWKRGKYDNVTVDVDVLRVGTYGDPAAVPMEVWKKWIPEKWTGYTAMWRDFPALRRWCMASVSSVEEKAEAEKLGWTTFRVLGPGEDLDPRGEEHLCPASRTGALITCLGCLRCGTNNRDLNVAIHVHGSGQKWFKPRQLELL